MTQQITERAWTIVRTAVPTCDRDTSCLYFAAAAYAAIGSGWRFAAGGAMLPDSGVCGWGISVSPRDRTYSVTADREIDECGSYCGHCWVQNNEMHYRPVVDIMAGYFGPRHDAERLIVYHEIPSLARSIKRHHADNLRAVRLAAKQDSEFVEMVRFAAQSACRYERRF